MASFTMFTFGYWGWGSSTKLLLDASAAVEEARGFAPPLFVDLRISRSVRAGGFRDRAFEKQAGSARYRWMPALGNRSVRDKLRKKIVIDDPSAARELLDLIEQSAKDKRRVIAFCACEYPGSATKPQCHRRVVANLVLEAAKKRRMDLDVREWPGGEPERRSLDVSPVILRRLAAQGSLAPNWPVAEIAGLPCGTRIDASAGDDTVTFLSAAAKPSKGKLVIPQGAWGWDDWDAALDQVREYGLAR